MGILPPLVLLAMVPFLLGTDPDTSRVPSDANASNYTMLLEGLLMILAVVYPMCWILQYTTRGSSPKITKDTDTDTDMTSMRPCSSTEQPLPPVVFIAPHGTKWHADRNCGSLKKCTKVQEYAACQFCSKKWGWSSLIFQDCAEVQVLTMVGFDGSVTGLREIGKRFLGRNWVWRFSSLCTTI